MYATYILIGIQFALLENFKQFWRSFSNRIKVISKNSEIFLFDYIFQLCKLISDKENELDEKFFEIINWPSLFVDVMIENIFNL